MRQTSHLLNVSDALGQMFLSQLPGLQFKKKIGIKVQTGTGEQQAARRKERANTSYSLVSFLHPKSAKSLQQHYSIGN